MLLVLGLQWLRKAILRAGGLKALPDEEAIFRTQPAAARAAPEFVVGIMLTSFGIFRGAEGAGATWPGADAALLVVEPAVALFALILVAALRRTVVGDASSEEAPDESEPAAGAPRQQRGSRRRPPTGARKMAE